VKVGVSLAVVALLAALVVIPTRVSAAEPMRVTTSPAADRQPSWTHDGHIVFESDRSGDLRIWKIPAAGGPAVQITFGPGSDRWPEVSPDGTMIAFSRYDPDSLKGNIYMVPVNGGAETQVTLSDHPDDMDWHPTWTPDGTTIYFNRRPGDETDAWELWSVPATGGVGTLFFGEGGVTSDPKVSPDGNSIAVSYFIGGFFPYNVIEIPIADPENWTQLTFGSHSNSGPGSYHPDGTRLLIGTRNNHCAGWTEEWELDLNTLELAQLTNDIPWNPVDPAHNSPEYSPDGTKIVYSARRGEDNHDIWIMPAESCPPPSFPEPVRVTTSPAGDRMPSWTHDGQIVFESDRSGVERIWKIPVEGGVAVQLTFGPGLDRFPEVSPDGTMIAFARYDPDSLRGNIYIVPIDGGPTTQITVSDHPDDMDWHPTWTPDGSTIYFNRRPGDDTGTWEVWSVPDTGGVGTLFFGEGGITSDPKISPDGNFMALSYFVDGQDPYNLIQIPISDPNNWTQLSYGVCFNTGPGSYHPDGTRLLVGTRDHHIQGWTEEWELDLGTLEFKQLTNDIPDNPVDPAHNSPEYSPDGMMVVFSAKRGEDNHDIWILSLEEEPVPVETSFLNVRAAGPGSAEVLWNLAPGSHADRAVVTRAASSRPYLTIGEVRPAVDREGQGRFLDESIAAPGVYRYRVEILYRDGLREILGPVEIGIGVIQPLLRSTVNPFIDRTTIQFSVAAGGRTQIEILGLDGRLVRRLADDFHDPGTWTVDWDARDESGRQVGSGVYFVRVRTEDDERTLKLIRTN